MRLNFIKTFGQKIVVSVLGSGAVTAGAELLFYRLLLRGGAYLSASGYRSSVLGPDGFKPEACLLWLVLAGTFVFLLSFYLLMQDSISYMKQLVLQVKKIAGGDFDTPIAVRGRDEMADMAENLNQMQENIKEIMERERIAEHTKDDLISSVAHDLRTPLTSVIGYLGWLQTQQEADEELRRKYIDIAYNKAKSLEKLTNELFGFVKLEHREMSLHIGKMDLIQLLEQLLDENTPSFVEHQLQVRFEKKTASIPIEADGELLARLYNNLLNNAVKYGKDGKLICVEAEADQNMAKTRIKNYGQVIPEEALHCLFRKFYRVEASRSQNTGGTGLGLAIVEQITTLHGGTVTAKSDLQGTVFEVCLPLKQKEEL